MKAGAAAGIRKAENTVRCTNAKASHCIVAINLTNRKSVILVDDDPAILRSVGRLLEQYGFSVARFDSVEAFQTRADLDDAFCIVLDINLKDGSGIELRRRLSELGVLLPVIFITGNDSAAMRDAALQAGCAAYLAKPFAARSLIEPIRRAAAIQGASTLEENSIR